MVRVFSSIFFFSYFLLIFVLIIENCYVGTVGMDQLVSGLSGGKEEAQPQPLEPVKATPTTTIPNPQSAPVLEIQSSAASSPQGRYSHFMTYSQFKERSNDMIYKPW